MFINSDGDSSFLDLLMMDMNEYTLYMQFYNMKAKPSLDITVFLFGITPPRISGSYMTIQMSRLLHRIWCLGTQRGQMRTHIFWFMWTPSPRMKWYKLLFGGEMKRILH